MNLAKNRVFFSLIIGVLILITAAAAVFWARGFKPNFKQGRIDRTGLIVIASLPTGASVFLDGRLTSATDTNIAFLEPKTYKIKIEKEGYTTWEKEVEVKADLATEIKALLFPVASAQIRPLTISGAFNPVLSPDEANIVYAVPGEHGGLYLLSMSDRPFPFRQDARVLIKNTPSFDFSKAKFIFSPDSKQIIAHFEDEKGNVLANLLFDTDKSNQQARDITASLTATLNSWQEEINTKTAAQSAIVPDSVKSATGEAKIDQQQETSDKSQASSPLPGAGQANTGKDLALITSSLSLNYYPAGLIFSPDEEKVLFHDKNQRFKVYDLKKKKEFTLPDFENFIHISWYPDSNHLVVAQKNLISIIESDGANKMKVYSGKFEDGFVFTHPSAARIIILTTLAQSEGTPPNLYSIDLR